MFVRVKEKHTYLIARTNNPEESILNMLDEIDYKISCTPPPCYRKGDGYKIPVNKKLYRKYCRYIRKYEKTINKK